MIRVLAISLFAAAAALGGAGTAAAKGQPPGVESQVHCNPSQHQIDESDKSGSGNHDQNGEHRGEDACPSSSVGGSSGGGTGSVGGSIAGSVVGGSAAAAGGVGGTAATGVAAAPRTGGGNGSESPAPSAPPYLTGAGALLAVGGGLFAVSRVRRRRASR